MDTGAVQRLLEHGILGALVVGQTGVILWLIKKLVDVSTRLRNIEDTADRLTAMLDDASDDVGRPN